MVNFTKVRGRLSLYAYRNCRKLGYHFALLLSIKESFGARRELDKVLIKPIRRNDDFVVDGIKFPYSILECTRPTLVDPRTRRCNSTRRTQLHRDPLFLIKAKYRPWPFSLPHSLSLGRLSRFLARVHRICAKFQFRNTEITFAPSAIVYFAFRAG